MDIITGRSGQPGQVLDEYCHMERDSEQEDPGEDLIEHFSFSDQLENKGLLEKLLRDIPFQLKCTGKCQQSSFWSVWSVCVCVSVFHIIDPSLQP